MFQTTQNSYITIVLVVHHRKEIHELALKEVVKFSETLQSD